MEMPKPGDAHRRLQKLVGAWTGTEKLHPSPWDPVGGPAKARVLNRSILDGFGVIQEYEQSRGGQVNFRGLGVFWYDDEKKEYVMTWWDSMAGRPGEYRGQFEGDVLRLAAPMPGGTGHSRTAFDTSKPGRYAFSMDISPDGQQWMPSMEGTYTTSTKGSKAKKPTKGTKATKATKKVAKKKSKR